MLVDGPVEIGPRTGDLQVRLVGEPPVTRGMTARAGGLDELRGETLYPPVDGDVVNGNAALGEQLFDVTVGQAVPQVPPDRERDHLRGEPEACEAEVVRRAVTRPVSGHPRSTNATVPAYDERLRRVLDRANVA